MIPIRKYSRTFPYESFVALIQEYPAILGSDGPPRDWVGRGLQFNWPGLILGAVTL